MAVKKDCKSKCIFFDFLGENLEIAPKQGKNGDEVCDIIESVVHLFSWAWSCFRLFPFVHFSHRIRFTSWNFLRPVHRFQSLLLKMFAFVQSVRPVCPSSWFIAYLIMVLFSLLQAFINKQFSITNTLISSRLALIGSETSKGIMLAV